MQNNHFPRLEVSYEILGKKKFNPHVFEGSIADVEVTIRDQAGRIRKQFKRPFKSFVSNFARVLQYAFLAVNNSTTGNTIDKIIRSDDTPSAASIHTMAVNEAELASPTGSNYGIKIGDVEDRLGLGYVAAIGGAIDYDDFDVRGELKPDGSDAPDTDLVYRVNVVGLSNSDQTLTIRRRFQNNHATYEPHITEHGLFGKSTTDYFLLARDVAGGGEDEGQDLVLANAEIWEATYVFTITDASGFTKNLLRMLSSEFIAANAISQVRDTSGVVQTINFSSARTQKDLLAGSGVDTFGINVSGLTDDEFKALSKGESVASPTTSDYRLGNVNFSKALTAQLTHGAVMPVTMEQANQYTVFGLYRDFENPSTDSYYVYDSGLVIRQGTSPYTYYLIARDLVATSTEVPYVELAEGQILRVKYLFKFGI